MFVNSSPPDISTLHKANKLLISTLQDHTTLLSPIHGYIEKLASGSEWLYIQNIVHQYNANNLYFIIKKRTTQKSGKRIVLSGHFYISIQALLDGVIAAEKETKEQAAKKGKKNSKEVVDKAKFEGDNKEEAIDKSKSKTEDCIIVDID